MQPDPRVALREAPVSADDIADLLSIIVSRA
jgi:hypothetical protein